jgi:hypothetical protein
MRMSEHLRKCVVINASFFPTLFLQAHKLRRESSKVNSCSYKEPQQMIRTYRGRGWGDEAKGKFLPMLLLKPLFQ